MNQESQAIYWKNVARLLAKRKRNVYKVFCRVDDENYRLREELGNKERQIVILQQLLIDARKETNEK